MDITLSKTEELSLIRLPLQRNSETNICWLAYSLLSVEEESGILDVLGIG